MVPCQRHFVIRICPDLWPTRAHARTVQPDMSDLSPLIPNRPTMSDHHSITKTFLFSPPQTTVVPTGALGVPRWRPEGSDFSLMTVFMVDY